MLPPPPGCRHGSYTHLIRAAKGREGISVAELRPLESRVVTVLCVAPESELTLGLYLQGNVKDRTLVTHAASTTEAAVL